MNLRRRRVLSLSSLASLAIGTLPVFVAVACGGAAPKVDAAAAPSASASGAPSSSAAPAASHPFAGSAGEAQSMIQDAIDSRMKDLWKCVAAYRQTAGDPHRPVVIHVGIDQQGHLLGVTSTGATPLDPTLQACMMTALKGLPFPSSHAGVITITQTFQDQSVQM